MQPEYQSEPKVDNMRLRLSGQLNNHYKLIVLLKHTVHLHCATKALKSGLQDKTLMELT